LGLTANPGLILDRAPMSRPSTSSRPNKRRPVGQRSGFSLIEILVVIGLIAFLTAAMVAVIPRVGNAAKVASTKATIKKVDEMLNDRINGFRRWIQKQDQQAGLGTPGYVLQAQATSGSTILSPGTSLAAAKVIAIKTLFRSYFPQTYAELNNTYFPQTGAPPSSTSNAQSAACLYLIITKGPLFDTEPPSAADLKAIETADTDGDGVPEIVDAWGQPLRFYRWPTRLVRPAAYSSTNMTGALTSPGPIDEVPQQPVATPPPSVFIPPSPLAIAMIGAVPRPSVPVWTKSTQYSPGAKVVSGNTTSGSSNSVIYQCVGAGTSGAGPASPFGTTAQVVGTTIADNTVAWQVLVDPLSLDPDDPFGIATSFISETPSASSALPPLTPNTWSVPLIVSCGTDGQLGLYEPSDTTNFGMLAQPQLSPLNPNPPHLPIDPSGFNRDPMYDNITNHQQ
jgi:prepilin-type N-terminal cleavage/methylation domain-containing protein